MRKIATYAITCMLASLAMADIGSDFVSTETQTKSEQAKIDKSNKELGQLRGALKVLNGNQTAIKKQIAED